MQKIKEVKAKKEFLEKLGAAALVIFTWTLSGLMAGMGLGLILAHFLT